jgi:hypothetical protein
VTHGFPFHTAPPQAPGSYIPVAAGLPAPGAAVTVKAFRYTTAPAVTCTWDDLLAAFVPTDPTAEPTLGEHIPWFQAVLWTLT